MRIAQVAPLSERVPPHMYGGTERIVFYLTEELVKQGHQVTLFASGDSVTNARLVAACDGGLRLDSKITDDLACRVLQLEQVLREMDDFDILHFHIDWLHFPMIKRMRTANLTTFHGRLDLPELVPLFREFSDLPAVSISDAQRKPLAWINWQGTVHHGLPIDLYRPGKGDGGYLLFLGRVAPEKRVDRAIEIAVRSNMKLKIASKVDPADREYMESEIRPLLNHSLIDFVGEVGHAEKQALLQDAYALLFPIDWSEPFGLVMIEAMACGTPVIAYRDGSIPEVIDDGVTGFIVESLEQSIAALERVQQLDRRRCRRIFEERFSSRRMAENYVKIYQRLVEPGRRAFIFMAQI